MSCEVVRRTCPKPLLLITLTMGKVHTSIEINASAAVVSQVLYQFNKYPEWNTFLTFVEGANNDYSGRPSELQDETITIMVDGADGKEPKTFECKVTQTEPYKLTWSGHFLSKYIIQGEHYFEIEAVGENRCIFKHGENFSGVVAKGLDWTSFYDKIVPNYERMNRDIKARAEKGLSKL